MPTIVLASQSTSRRRLLESAGLSPKIMVSNVDEDTEFFNAMHPVDMVIALAITKAHTCLLYTSPSPRDRTRSRMPSSA